MIELRPIRESPADYDQIEKRILAAFRKQLYYPIFKILGKSNKTVRNAVSESIEDAILEGRLTYTDGHFVGKFNAQTSRELKEIGATWDKKSQSFKLPFDDLTNTIKLALSLRKVQEESKLRDVSAFLSKFNTEEFAESIKVVDIFDKSLFKVEKDFQASVRNITVAPTLEPEQRQRIATEWQQNLELYIQKFSDENILELREMVRDNIFNLGNRREVLESSIEQMLLSIDRNWPKVQAKAKFLAKQETSLAMAKYKQTRYEAAGVRKYRWACVHMPHQPTPKAPYKKGEVRYSHGILEGKIFTWDNPPITTNPTAKKQQRCNPGQDYNCRCFAIPIVEFNT